ncbi:MAG: DUF4242 domain-containing protein [Fulvivirga sp.]
MENLKRGISKKSRQFIFYSLVLASCNYSENQKSKEMTNVSKELSTYVIEREIENVGSLSPEELKVVAQESNAAIKEIGSDIQWQHSYLVGNKTYCIYKARDKSLIIEHAKKAGAPVDNIRKVSSVIDPGTAD